VATVEEQEKLMQTLRFTPRTYRISLWGYGGEIVMGTVDRKHFDYFKRRRLDLSDYAWNYDYAEENNIPEDNQPFPPGSWYECDDMAHSNGVDRDSGTLQIDDENGETILEKDLGEFDGDSDDSPRWDWGEETWITQAGSGQVVFVGRSNEKGTFFEGDIELTQPFDITKLVLFNEEIDGTEMITGVMYDGEDIDNWGGSTDGKSSDFGFYLVNDNDSWEVYRNEDDIVYPMTDWFPKKIKPVRDGIYMVKTAGKNSYTHQARWTGTRWISAWIDTAQWDTADEVKIKEWQGLAVDPNADDSVTDLEKALEELKQEFEALCGEEDAA